MSNKTIPLDTIAWLNDQMRWVYAIKIRWNSKIENVRRNKRPLLTSDSNPFNSFITLLI